MENRCIMDPLYTCSGPKGVYNGKTCIMEPLYTSLAPKGVYNEKTCIMEPLCTTFEILDTLCGAPGRPKALPSLVPNTLSSPFACAGIQMERVNETLSL